MPPLLFDLMQSRNRGRPGAALGWPPFIGAEPLPSAPPIAISGITRDSTGAVLGGVTVQVFETATDRFITEVVSDPTTGAYIVPVGIGTGPYYLVAYKAGGTDVAGTTVNTLAGA